MPRPQRLLALALLCSLEFASVTPAAAQFGQRRIRPQGATPSAPAAPVETAPTPNEPGPGSKPYGFTFFDARDAVERGEGRPALLFYESAAAAAEQRGARVDAGTAYACVAFVAVRLSELQKALASARKALDLLRQEPNLSNDQMGLMVSVYSVLGGAYRNAGDRQQARKWYEEGLAYARATVSPHRRGAAMWVAGLLRQIALITYQERDYTDARDRAQEAATLAEHFLGAAPPPRTNPRAIDNGRRQAAESLTLLAKAQLALGDKDAAEAALKRAGQYSRLVGLVEVDLDILTTAGQVALARNDSAAALAEFQKALPQAERIGRVGTLVQLHHFEARSYAGLGRPADALTSLRRSMDLIEEIRGTLQESSLRSGYVEDKQGIYQFAVRMALRTRNSADAFAFAERARARAFLDLLGNSTTLSKGRTRALVQEEVALRARLAEAQALASDSDTGEARRAKEAVEAADRDYRAFLERVRKENLEQASLMTVEPVTLTEIQGLLPEGTTLIEYLVGNTDIVVWIVERHRARALTVPSARADLVARVRALRTAIADQAPVADIESQAMALYDVLLAPARAEIRGSRLLIVPHDVLHYLPFAALRSPTGRWLVEDYAIATLPSASVLKYIAAKTETSGARPLALGNPDVGSALNLRYAEREARAVGEAYPGTTVLVRGEASEARVKALATGAGLLHFATHAELNENEPMSSALLLTPGEGEDGRLEVRELFGLDLHARLVVLSACETGLGKLSRGDDLVGLQRAFLYAGTPAVVTTLWKVDDRASFVLMREFYVRLKTAAPGEALSLAQRETLRQFPHPFAWAAYGLTGAPW